MTMHDNADSKAPLLYRRYPTAYPDPAVIVRYAPIGEDLMPFMAEEGFTDAEIKITMALHFLLPFSGGGTIASATDEQLHTMTGIHARHVWRTVREQEKPSRFRQLVAIKRGRQRKAGMSGVSTKYDLKGLHEAMAKRRAKLAEQSKESPSAEVRPAPTKDEAAEKFADEALAAYPRRDDDSAATRRANRNRLVNQVRPEHRARVLTQIRRYKDTAPVLPLSMKAWLEECDFGARFPKNVSAAGLVVPPEDPAHDLDCPGTPEGCNCYLSHRKTADVAEAHQ